MKDKVVLEIFAGTGGDEAYQFAAELARMYIKYADIVGWKTQKVDSNNFCYFISGDGVYSALYGENGVHRVQRIPKTEKNGRVHTSTAIVAVMKELNLVEIDIEGKDVRIDTFHSSGAGGQNVNKVESAIRITHIPTGIVAVCQNERSQIQNRNKAFEILKIKVNDYYNQQKQDEYDKTRKDTVGTGNRNEKIKTYNFPQDRLTDHRNSCSFYGLKDIMNGELQLVLRV